MQVQLLQLTWLGFQPSQGLIWGGVGVGVGGLGVGVGGLGVGGLGETPMLSSLNTFTPLPNKTNMNTSN